MRVVGVGLLSIGALVAQVEGVVRLGGQPVVGVRVWWSSGAGGAITDSLGGFVLPEPGQYPAYLRVEGEVDSFLVSEKPTKPLLWDLPPRTTLPTQAIVGERPSRYLSSQSVQSVETWTRAALTSAPCCNLS